MKQVIVPLNAYKAERMTELEQEELISAIAKAGADGVEIRRELLPLETFSFSKLGRHIRFQNLFSIYSAPIELWKEAGQFNHHLVTLALHEAKELGANMIKFPLGYFQSGISCLQELSEAWEEEYAACVLLVENDQTEHGGNMKRLKAFFENAAASHVPVKMTFDVGNWAYTGEDVYEALEQLRPYTVYVHLKHVEKKDGSFITLPLPFDMDAAWRTVLAQFPNNVLTALEFPLASGEMTKCYVNTIKEQESKVKQYDKA